MHVPDGVALDCCSVAAPATLPHGDPKKERVGSHDRSAGRGRHTVRMLSDPASRSPELTSTSIGLHAHMGGIAPAYGRAREAGFISVLCLCLCLNFVLKRWGRRQNIPKHVSCFVHLYSLRLRVKCYLSFKIKLHLSYLLPLLIFCAFSISPPF
jgi:hypothetical protein